MQPKPIPARFVATLHRRRRRQAKAFLRLRQFLRQALQIPRGNFLDSRLFPNARTRRNLDLRPTHLKRHKKTRAADNRRILSGRCHGRSPKDLLLILRSVYLTATFLPIASKRAATRFAPRERGCVPP